MMARIKSMKLDKKHFQHASETREADYSNAIVKKPWGYEFLVFKNDFVAIWLLHISRLQKTSLHCHPKKKTSLLVLNGKAVFRRSDERINLSEMDAVIIEKGVYHSTEASSPYPLQPVSADGIWVMEIESPPLKTDLVRMRDEYGRAGESYEGTENWVLNPANCFKLSGPDDHQIIQKKFLNYVFTVTKGKNLKKHKPSPKAKICVIDGDRSSLATSSLLAGELYQYPSLKAHAKNHDISDFTFLIIERVETMVKVSDYIFNTIADLGVTEVFAVCGGAAMHLVDSLGKNDRLHYIATHHEQAAAMAAEGYARISGKPGCVLVTSGPGGTNTITGLYGAWIDSIPVIFISGQVTSDSLIRNSGLRQYGIQEANIVELVKPVTKYAVTVDDASKIKYHMQKAIHLAVTGRKGPVWLDIPLDIQNKMVTIDDMESYIPETHKTQQYRQYIGDKAEQALNMARKARRPVLIYGYGIHSAAAEKEFYALYKKLNLPTVSSWTASDIIATDDPLYVGRCGIMGDRAGNFAVQNADLLLILGSRMSIPQVGYNPRTFARAAKRVMVDIDETEFKKPSIPIDLPVHGDVLDFIVETLKQLKNAPAELSIGNWIKRCSEWKTKYPVALPEYKNTINAVNSFYFVDLLSRKLDKHSVVVTDMGTSFTCTMQTFRTKQGQRLFTSSGHASMGFGLPGAIGACYGHGRKKTICISGDGGLQMNIQELQTLVSYNLPIILFVLNNNGYLTIKLMQQNHFGRYVGSDPSSGLRCPDIMKIAVAYGIKAIRISNQDQLDRQIDAILSEQGPFICEIMMPEDQPLIPRVSSMKKPDGSIVSKPLEDLYPFLDRKEFLGNMIIEPFEILK